MALSLQYAPYIFVYQNSLCINFPNKTQVQTEFDIDNVANQPFFIKTTLLKLNDASTLDYRGVSLGVDPTTPSEGLNQLDIAIPLTNGVYKITSLQISLNGVAEDIIISNVQFNVNYHIPSYNESLINL